MTLPKQRFRWTIWSGRHRRSLRLVTAREDELLCELFWELSGRDRSMVGNDLHSFGGQVVIREEITDKERKL